MLSTGEIFKKHREKASLRQQDLGDKLGCTSQYISGVERNAFTISPNVLEKFYELFPVTLEEKEAIAFYEDYRSAGFKTKLYIEELENENRKLREEIDNNRIGLQVIEYIHSLGMQQLIKNNKK